jgi:hypothetical protein
MLKKQKPRKVEKKRPFQIVKLEERIAPKLAVNYNETLVRAPAKAKPSATGVHAGKQKLQIVKLEERIAPKLATNHNETLVRAPVEAKPKATGVHAGKQKLQIVKLEERIAPTPSVPIPPP